MWKRFWLIAIPVIMLAGCSTTPKAPPPLPEPYTRIASPETNVIQLQIAVRKFVPSRGRGPTILLAGVSHIGDTNYYSALQKLLDAQTLVLFEGVNAEAHPRRVHKPGSRPATPKPVPPPADDTNAPFSMQSALAKSLGLVFQLEAIDYDRTNFLNSDLSIYDIERLVSGETNVIHEDNAPPERKTVVPETNRPAGSGSARIESVTTSDDGPDSSNSSFNALLQVMDGSSFLGSIVKLGIGWIGSSPKLQAITRFTLVESIGRLKGDMSGMQGVPPDMKKLLQILIESRNQNVIEDLKVELKDVPRSGSIAIFYGTGHMDDMERRVIQQLHYRPDGDTWLTAFSSDLRETGMSNAEIQFLRNVIKRQLEMMQPPE